MPAHTGERSSPAQDQAFDSENPIYSSFYTQPGHRAEHAKYSRRAAKINSNSTELFVGMLYRANNNSPERAAFICEVNTDGILPK